MRYTVPDYYKTFRCIAGECPATCCAGWQIMIDDTALKNYMELAGVKHIKRGIPVRKKQGGTPFGSRLANSIDWENQTFLQYDGRCAFLNEQNLCDIYTEAGEQAFCRTCRNYPRHIEEFENEREISLSLSCPVVARMLLNKKEKVQFISKETEREEQYDEFDEFLYFILQDSRSAMISILQDRDQPIVFRIAKVLALAHDIQNRIDAEKIFEIETVLERYQRAGADEALKAKFAKYVQNTEQEEISICEKTQAATFERRTSNLPLQMRRALSEGNGGLYKNTAHKNRKNKMELRKNLMDLLYEMEVLDLDWPEQMRTYKKLLYSLGAENYHNLRKNFIVQMPWLEMEAEQLMVYFLFTYFCGAVYDGDAFSKVKMAAVCTLLIQEMELAEAVSRSYDVSKIEDMRNKANQQNQAGGEAANKIDMHQILTLEDRARIAWRFSRELEHSDLNLETMEKLMKEDEAAEFYTLLRCIC